MVIGLPVKDSYKILIINGGGVFGYIPAHFLNLLTIKNPLVSLIDAMGGCSIGAIECLFLAQNNSTQELYNFFIKNVDGIFSDSFISDLNPFGAKYSDKYINTLLQKTLPGTYNNLSIPVIIPCVDFKKNNIKIFDNISDSLDLLWLTWEIARSTMAAPTYFNPWKVYIDGGIFANMPVMETVCALKRKIGIPFEKMDVFVLGTGEYKNIDRDMSNIPYWTELQWIQPLLGFLIKGNELRSNFLAQSMPFRSYNYFNPIILSNDWEMDDSSIIPDLKVLCDKYDEEFLFAFNTFLNS
jgi:patatin-like phospholipase/acyl hydrolase